MDFNPRTHRGVRLLVIYCIIFKQLYFNPRTHRGVRRYWQNTLLRHYSISIHAPIVGCDGANENPPLSHPISIHAPIVGCDVIFQH